jgi:hypothetical protein
VANHRSKSVVERNLPRWFRKPGFKAWDDFTAFFKQGGAGEDAALKTDWDDLEQKGDDAQPKALGRLIKAYNKGRKFSKTEVAPPWFFVESVPAGRTLPPDDAWTIDLSNELDHERSQRPAAPRPERKRDKAPAAAGTEGAPAPAPEEPPAEPPVTGVVPPPTSDKTWIEALRRLPGAVQLLVDGRGKNTSELNDRRRRALELAQLDRFHNLAAKGNELRKQILTWALEKKPSADEITGELKKHAELVEDWIKTQVEAARQKVAGLDEHAREELHVRLRKLYPKVPDEGNLARIAKQALDAARPKRLGNWAKKVIDDFNNSRGSASEKVRDPWLIDGLVRWLTTKRDQDTPTDGEIYDQIQRLGGPNMAAKKRRQEGPRPPKQQERKSQREIEAEAEERAALAEARAAEQAKRRPPKPAPAPPAAPAGGSPDVASEAPPPPPPPPPAAAPAPPPSAAAPTT